MSAATHWVSDEVWARLDPRIGRLTRRGRLLLTAALITITLMIAGAAAVGASGLIRPHVRALATKVALDTREHAAVLYLRVSNGDWLAERVEGVTTDTRGVTISRWSRTSVAAHGHRVMTVRVTFDCAAPPRDEVTLVLWLHRPWGTARAVVRGQGGRAWTACGNP